MRKLIFFIAISFIISCNSNELESDDVGFSDVIIQESPWVLDRVEINEIRGNDGHTFSQSELDEIATLMKDNFYSTYEFYGDSTGLWNSESLCPECTFTWKEVTEENKIYWAPRNLFYELDIRSMNQIVELIRSEISEDGFGIPKPDGTFINGAYLDATYVWASSQ